MSIGLRLRYVPFDCVLLMKSEIYFDNSRPYHIILKEIIKSSTDNFIPNFQRLLLTENCAFYRTECAGRVARLILLKSHLRDLLLIPMLMLERFLITLVYRLLFQLHRGESLFDDT